MKKVLNRLQNLHICSAQFSISYYNDQFDDYYFYQTKLMYFIFFTIFYFSFKLSHLLFYNCHILFIFNFIFIKSVIFFIVHFDLVRSAIIFIILYSFIYILTKIFRIFMKANKFKKRN